MSFKQPSPPVVLPSGRVNAIKSQFESLNSFESSSDVKEDKRPALPVVKKLLKKSPLTTTLATRTGETTPLIKTEERTRNQFHRSATSVDIILHRSRDKTAKGLIKDWRKKEIANKPAIANSKIINNGKISSSGSGNNSNRNKSSNNNNRLLNDTLSRVAISPVTRIKTTESEDKNLLSLNKRLRQCNFSHSNNNGNNNDIIKKNTMEIFAVEKQSLDLKEEKLEEQLQQEEETKDEELKQIKKQCHNENNNNKYEKKSSSIVVDNDDDGDDVEKQLVKEKVEVRLSRHTSDPVKRSSIKRTPAFRVGDKYNKIPLLKHQQPQLSSSSTSTSSASPKTKHFNNERFENFLNKNYPKKDIEKLQQSCLTDSLKAALKKPLPSGPPPKKPPRTFILSNNSNNPVQFITTESNDKEKENNGFIKTYRNSDGGNMKRENDNKQEGKASKSSIPKIKDKINFLENNLNINNKPRNVPTRLQKSKTELVLNNSKKLLDCISCHRGVTSMIYESVNSLEKQPLLSNHNNQNNNESSVERFPEKRKSSVLIEKHHECEKDEKCFYNRLENATKEYDKEPIYMEPFSHLKKCRNFSHHHHHHHHNLDENSYKNSSGNSMEFSSNESTSLSTMERNGNTCKCQENHKTSDLHYMCTAINSDFRDETASNRSQDFSQSSDKEGNISLRKTYDEITILVDAAFQQNLNNNKENYQLSEGGGNSNDDSHHLDEDFSQEVELRGTNTIPLEKNASSKLTPPSIKICRTLTQKRKDYVRRVSIVAADIPPEKIRIHNYGTLNRKYTIKPSNLKTFAFNENSRSKEGNNLISSSSVEMEKVDQINNQVENHKELNGNDFINSSSFNAENKIDDHEVKDDDNAGCNAKILKKSPKLFQVCLLVGYNSSNKSAYIKFKYPPDEPVPDNIEQLIFPNSSASFDKTYTNDTDHYQDTSRNKNNNDKVISLKSDKNNQEYYLILTDDNGFKVYGYCRKVLPENSEICLPLCYCLISVKKALGFYQKLLKEIETRHGQSEQQLKLLLSQLYLSRIPEPGKYLHVKIPLLNRQQGVNNPIFSSNHKISSPKRLSLEANPKWLTETALTQIQSSSCSPASNSTFFCDILNTNSNNSGNNNNTEEKEQSEDETTKPFLFHTKKSKTNKANTSFDLSLINRSLIMRDPKFDEILIRRPNDIRLENTELSDLLQCLGPELLISCFSTLLLERKCILQSSNVTLLSKSILALQTILYPFQWQYTIVTILPRHLLEICQAPFPILIGILESEVIPYEVEDGMVINLDKKRVVQCCGDEQTIIPITLQESLQLSLEMVDLIDQGKMLSSVLISEAFLRFFIKLFGDYRKSYFHKEKFIQSHKLQSVKFFLEWFVETSMFRHFCNERYSKNSSFVHQSFKNQKNKEEFSLNDNDDQNDDDEDVFKNDNEFYNLFEARLLEKSENKGKAIQNIETIMKNSKIINNSNKKGKTLKERFKEFLNTTGSGNNNNNN